MNKPMRVMMRITSITETRDCEMVEFHPVYYSDNSKEKTFVPATLAGTFILKVKNNALRGVYQPDDLFRADFTPLPKDA